MNKSPFKITMMSYKKQCKIKNMKEEQYHLEIINGQWDQQQTDKAQAQIITVIVQIMCMLMEMEIWT